MSDTVLSVLAWQTQNMSAKGCQNLLTLHLQSYLSIFYFYYFVISLLLVVTSLVSLLVSKSLVLTLELLVVHITSNTSKDGHCVYYFYQLKLKSVETEQFPAKTVMKWSPKVLEHRRQAFEKYLQVCKLLALVL